MNDMDRKLKQMEDSIRNDASPKRTYRDKSASFSGTNTRNSHPLAEFLIGLVLVGAGVYWVLNSFVVTFDWGGIWGGFGMSSRLATGLMLIPLLLGIALLFFLDRKWIGWVVTAIGVLVILVTLLTSVRFRPISATLWQYVVMFGMIAAGVGLLARGLLKSRS